jgi:hypothetical protein
VPAGAALLPPAEPVLLIARAAGSRILILRTEMIRAVMTVRLPFDALQVSG